MKGGDELARKWSWYFRNLNENNKLLLINFKKALLYRGIKEETVFEYQKDMKDAKKGKKDAAHRVEKSDMKTAYGCGGATKKLVKKNK